VPPGAAYPRVPTLILNGDLDNITPLEDARVVAARFPRSTLVTIENSAHVTALGDTFHCASVIYATFVRTLAAGDTSCARHTPAVRVVRDDPASWRGVAAAAPAAGDRSTAAERRVATAAAQTVADALQRWWINYSGTDRGLYGGTWSYTGSARVVFRLRRVVLVPGVAVTGTVRWAYTGGGVVARVRVSSPPARERLRMTWSMRVPSAVARLRGTAGGRPLAARMPAP
jgi:hypothetical protein